MTAASPLIERESIVREIAELETANAAATSWGAAVGARNERLQYLRAQLRYLNRLATGAPTDADI